MIAIFAHGFGGTNGLPIPRWLLAYILAALVVLTFVVLRFVRPARRLDEPSTTISSPDEPMPAWFVVTRVVGLVLLVATFLVAAIGVNDSGANIAPVTVIVLFFLGMQVVSAVFGDVFWWFDPFDTLALLLVRNRNEGDEGSEPNAPAWTAAAFLAGFIWFVFAYPEFYPPTPGEVAVFLAVYTLAALAGAVYWGRPWVRLGEGFGALFGALAQLFRRRAPGAGPGLATLLVVYLGGILFDGISQTNWWIDVLGTTRGWTERAINTVGLAWSIAIVAVAYMVATRVVAAITSDAPADTARRFAPVLLPIGLAWSVAHYLSAFLIDVQNFYALLSDPFGQGWNVFGTIDYAVNYQVFTPTEIGWIQTAVLAAGSIGAAIVTHDIAFSSYRGRTAVRVTYPFAVLVIASSVGAIWLLLGV